jgi:hypothetical protein
MDLKRKVFLVVTMFIETALRSPRPTAPQLSHRPWSHNVRVVVAGSRCCPSAHRSLRHPSGAGRGSPVVRGPAGVVYCHRDRWIAHMALFERVGGSIENKQVRAPYRASGAIHDGHLVLKG